MDEYEAQFTALLRFVPYLKNDGERKARKFVEGLKLEIRQKMSSMEFRSLEEELRAAQNVEFNLGQEALEQHKEDTKGKSKTQPFSSSGFKLKRMVL